MYISVLSNVVFPVNALTFKGQKPLF